ncbi:DnaA ATPase domain-containing protein [Aquimarina sp. W85]|uniref:DnaA ATPase domain-containing protein n=1 Tax=Aquimarina rhodophyticola TaxID=3342246 RepID=UPI00366ED59A
MEERILKSKDVLAHLYQENILPVLEHRIKSHDAIISDILKLQTKQRSINYSSTEKNRALADLTAYKKDISALINAYFVPNKYTPSNHPLTTYYVALERYLDSLDETIIKIQDRDRFYPTTTDTKAIRFKKYGKRLLFKLSKSPVRFTNFFRRLFKKEERPIPYWTHTIPYKNLTQYYFKSELTRKLLPIIDSLYKEITVLTNVCWSIDTAYDKKINAYLEGADDFDMSDTGSAPSEVIIAASDKITQLSQQIDVVFNEIFEEYNDAIDKCDTIELSRSEFSDQRILEKQKHTVQLLLKNEQRWDATHELLNDDWGLDNEIYIIVFTLLSTYFHTKQRIAERAVTINLHLDTLISNLTISKNAIITTDKDTVLKTVIAKELQAIRKDFIPKIIVGATTYITSQDVPEVLTTFDETVQALLKDISHKRAISTTADYLTPTKLSEINYTSPYELINYESWPLFSKIINTAKVDMSLSIEEAIETIEALGQTIEFNLESALTLFDTASLQDNPETIAVDGIQRSIDKITALKQSILDWETSNHTILYPGVDGFIKRSVALTETENIYNIRLTIAKAKSVEKSKAIKQKVVNTVINFVPIAITKLRTTWLKTKDKTQSFLLRTGLYKPATNITKDLSDFLKEEKQALEQLPFIYKRLFHLDTVTSEDLFVGRSHDLALLNTAYTSWQRTRFSSVIIYGERGAGKTSLLDFFINSIPKTTKTIIASPIDALYSSEALFEFLNSVFAQELYTFEDWVSYLNSGSKKVIVLENIQYLYVRKVKGFEALHQISELMYATQKSVFWILTCAKYSYQFLDKAIQLSERFSYRIDIDGIDTDTMTQALLKRHKKSGYDLMFEEPPREYLTKKINKASNEEKQRLLKEDFFKDLTKIARSNFKIAFTYWLRSTTTVSGNVITLRSLKSIDVTFLEKLAPNKLFMLHAILLQEKVTLDTLVSLSGFDKQKTHRIVNSLYENGLLTLDKESYYNINTLLYRQITNLLKSKNFIH